MVSMKYGEIMINKLKKLLKIDGVKIAYTMEKYCYIMKESGLGKDKCYGLPTNYG